MGQLPLEPDLFDRYVDDAAAHYQFLPKVLKLEQLEDFEDCLDADGHPDWSQIKEGFRDAPAIERSEMAQAVMLVGQSLDVNLQMISELGYDVSAVEGAMTSAEAALVTEAVEEWVKDPSVLSQAERDQQERVLRGESQ